MSHQYQFKTCNWYVYIFHQKRKKERKEVSEKLFTGLFKIFSLGINIQKHTGQEKNDFEEYKSFFNIERPA